MARAYGYKVYLIPIKEQYVDIADILTHEEAGTGLAAGGFIDRTTLISNNAEVEAFDLGLPTFGINVNGTPMALNGTDNPIRLLGLESGPYSSDTDTESSPEWDTETQGFSTPEAVSKSASIDFNGKAKLDDAAYKILRLVEKHSVSQGLMAKLARIGPQGYDEVTFGFGRFMGYSEENDAGSIVKWSSTFEFYGPSGLTFAPAPE